MNVNWKGVFPAITTQFRQDQSLDLAATAKHLETMIRAGIHGVVLLGTVGENTALEYEEKLSVLREMTKAARGRIPVLTGVAEYTTALACRFARDAEKIGVDGLMVLPAMVYKSDGRETIAHYRTVAQRHGLPIMAYNNPVSYSVDITPEMFRDLADVPNLVAVKESSENVRRVTDLVNLVGGRYILFAGVDDLVLESILLGVAGMGLRPGQCISRGEPGAVGPGHLRPMGAGARVVPLVHTAAAPGYQDQAGAVHQAGDGRNRARFRDGPRPSPAPRGSRARRDPGDHPPRDRDEARVTDGGRAVRTQLAASSSSRSRKNGLRSRPCGS